MNWLKIETIRGQLIFLTVILLIGFIVIGTTYNKLSSIKEETLQQSRFLSQFQLKIKEAHIALSRAQGLETRFKLHKTLTLVKQHQSSVKQIRQILEVLKRKSPDSNGFKLLSKLDQALTQYHIAFKKLVVATKEIGFTSDSGLLGNLNRSAVNIERVIRSIGNSSLSISLLNIRHREKNYLLNSNYRNLTQLKQSMAHFNRKVLTIKLPLLIKTRIAYDIKQYENSVKEILFAREDERHDTKSLAQKAFHMGAQFDKVLSYINTFTDRKNLSFSQRSSVINLIFLVVLIGISILISVMFVMLTRKIARSLKTIKTTIDSISAGDYSARTHLSNKDELGDLGRSFDSMVQDRVSSLAKIEKENNQLNDSIINLLEAVSSLSDKDLTVQVPVAEDVTGAIGDAINLLASATGAVLNNIQTSAEQVDQTSVAVQEQCIHVSRMADSGRKVLDHTVSRLEQSAITMNDIAERSKKCDTVAAQASNSTADALGAVNNAVDGMIEIREIISETEKRIKRLGERSQEINSIVEIINVVAERTHVLALNASMQAAAAGEAGRGFAVVADEVQRLAENSRSATLQISDLVNSIQSETSETMITMNRAISHVVSGSKLAEEAGKKMAATQEITAELISSVTEISKRSIQQAKISNDIRDRASLIKKSTEETSLALRNQMSHSNNLVDYASTMLESVRQFKLPNRTVSPLRISKTSVEHLRLLN
ncbi:type IV pilus biogenesis protein PilJ [hydrothermal vent metagenome]|uniref:Type IV pilus biogenesis protein PilJ n=1 Tax=hydrothermal vent metagenome TaxID=652676 RepID=A0A3B0Y8D9_9ZZZZ